MRHPFLSKAVAAAVAAAVGLGAGAANAALSSPAIATTAPSQSINLILDVWNPTSSAGEQVNLSYQYADVTAGGTQSSTLFTGSAFTPDTLTGPFTLAANPAGSGSVYQLDFGSVPLFGSTFGTGSGTDYAVVAANGVPGTGNSAIFTSSVVPTAIASTSLTGNIVGAIGGEAWGPHSATDSTVGGYTIDLTGTQNYSPIGGTFGSGTLNEGLTAGGAVGTALDFYEATPVTHKNAVVTPFANAQGDGFWYLSSNGDLTWNVLAASSPVPLPAAVWLLASGLAGLGAIGRRRRVA